MDIRVKFAKLPFQKKLLLYSLLLSVLPVLLLGSAASFVASSALQREVDEKHETTLRQIEFQVDALLKRIDYLSIQVAGDLAIEKSARLGISMDDRETLEATLDMVETIRKYRSLSEFSFNAYLVYNRSNTVYSNNLGLINKTEFPYYDALRKYEPRFTGSTLLPSHTYPNQPAFLIIRPVGSSSTVDGILFLEIDPSGFYELLDSFEPEAGSRMVAVSQLGRIVLSQNPEEIGTALARPFAERLEDGKRNSSADPVPYGDERFQVSIHRSGYNDWTYVMISPEGQLTAKSSLIRKVTWFMAGCLALFWGCIALLASKQLYNPIRALLHKLPNRTLTTRDGLQQLDAFMQQVMETNRRLDSELREKLPELRDNMLLKLLHGGMNENEYRDKTRHLSLPLNGAIFTVCVFEVDVYLEFRKSYFGKDRSLMMYALTKLASEMAETLFSSVSVASSLGQVSLIIGTENTGDPFIEKVEELCGRIRQKAKELFRFTLSAGVSRPRPHMRTIHESYEEAIDLLSFRLLLGRDLTVSFRSAESFDSVKQSTRILIKRQKSIVKWISEGNLELAQAEFHEMVREVPSQLPSFKPVIGIFTNLVGEIDHLLEQLGFELEQLFPENVYTSIHDAESLDQLSEWFTSQFFPAFRLHFERLTVSNQTKIVQQVVEFIQNGVESEVSLQEAASRFGLSSSQLSRMFKGEMQINFMDFIMETRMSKAKEWLVHSDLPIKDIASRLKYTTTQNFSRAFKQTTGQSPGQYRDAVRQSNP
ncbi:helix-turn-helix domain-containing protein [Paenibacillus nasutitermitis]|uniref:HTH araC/xylS-type domain-containing protein n=1 Tax=Paenibacillus nasutitermitis TaxID=1652958 RepID=A0A916ZCV7_9BACL|nr:helix-turn-helix domain-containing protein [Paenibacillus nasutitermitis]GGD88656.1 hypothetical protein GCM10010911_54040 [Paenibacillus nasutitermitis]